MDNDQEVRGQVAGKRGRGAREWYWNYFQVTVARSRDGRQRPATAVCTLCSKHVSPKIERIREHFHRLHPELVDSATIEKASDSQADIDSSEQLSEDGNSVLADQDRDLLKTMIAAATIDESALIESSTEIDKDWILKYYTATDTPDQVTCNLCTLEMMSETSLLVNHLFDVHSDLSQDDAGQEPEPEPIDAETPRNSSKTSTTEFSYSGPQRRPKASVWNHFEMIMVDGPDMTKVQKVKCKVCQQIVSPKVERLRRHVLENHADLADEETEERFLASKEATKMLVGKGDGDESVQKSRKQASPAPAAVKSLSELTMKKDAEGKRALIWSYFQLLHSPGPSAALKVIGAQCKICETLVSPKIERLRRHFLNHHSDILIGSDEFDITTILDVASKDDGTVKSESHSKVAPERSEMDWTRKYFDLRDDQAQCRLCLDLYEPHMESLHEHLRLSHQGILEFSDSSTIIQFKKENSFKEGEIEPIETTAEFEWEDADEIADEEQGEGEDPCRIGRCLLCENTLRSGSRHSASFRMWDKGCAESLCQAFSLADSFCQYFEAGKYCFSCQQLVRNIDFTQRALNRFRTLLSSYRHSYESLLRKKYQRLRKWEDKENEVQDGGSFHKLYGAIFKNQVKRPRGRPRKVPKREILKRPKIEVSSEDDFFEEKPSVVEYKTKYGRTCTSLNAVRDSQAATVSDDDDLDAGTYEPCNENSEDESKEQVVPKRRRGRPRKSDRANWPNSVETKPILSRRRKRNHGTSTGLGTAPKGDSTDPSSRVPAIKAIIATKSRPKFVCEVAGCNFSCYQKTWLDVHIRSRHENDDLPYHCDCGEKFANMTSYGLHQRKHTQDAKKRAHCLTCKKSFPDKGALKEHRAEVHRRTVKPKLPDLERCPFCSLVIAEGQLLSEHEKLHEVKVTEKLPYDCVLCHSQVFTNTMSLQAHVKAVHNPVVNNPKCDKCEKIFKSEKILRRHLKRAHVDEVPGPNWRCAECGLVSGNRAEYRAHFKEHVKPRPFLCAECGMTFKSKSNLRIHTMLHTGERPWQCKLCPKGFNQSSKLRAHEETHVEIKTYVCDKCGKAFRTARNIYQHQKFHCHPDGPLKGQEGSSGGQKKRRREAQQVQAAEESEEESDTSMASIPPARCEEDPGQFQSRHLGLPSYLATGPSSLSDMMTIDTRGSGIPFLSTQTHPGQGSYSVPIWITHGQQTLTLDSALNTGKMLM